jgi:integrase
VKVNIDFRTLRAFFETAVRWKLIEDNPFRGAKQIKVPPQRPTFLSKEDFKKLLDIVTIPWFKELIMFAVCTMMRSGEILALTWNSVDLRRRLILVENTKEFRIKTTRPRVVPMNDWVFKYLATRENKTGYIFVSPEGKRISVGYVSHRFKKYLRLAGLPDDFHFHSLRHTGATWLVQDGVSIYSVQKLLGHSNIAVTQVYSHLESGELFDSVNRISWQTPKQLNISPLSENKKFEIMVETKNTKDSRILT